MSFLEEARVGVAGLRNGDGETLVALPERDLIALVALPSHTLAFLSLDNAMRRTREHRRPMDFGELAWSTAFDDEDHMEFRAEYADGLASALAESLDDRPEEIIHARRVTSHHRGDDRVNADVAAGDVEVQSPDGNR